MRGCATHRSACFLGFAVAMLLMVSGVARADQRAAVLEAAQEIPMGARIIETPAGSVLVSAAVVAIPTGMSPDKAFSQAASAALIEARAEAALFVAGEYGSTVESGSSSSATNRPEAGSDATGKTDSKTVSESRSASWLRSQATSQARVRFTGGEPLEISRVEGGVRALVAWGLSQSGEPKDSDEAALGAAADKLLAETDVPACQLEWVKCTDGREGLRFSIVIYPDKPLGPCTSKQGGGCSCIACRKRVLELQVQRAVGGWAKEGDVAVARTLTRISRRTETRAKDGSVAVERVSNRLRSSKSSTSIQVVIPADFFRKSVAVYRHSDVRSVCVGFVPIDAVPGAIGAEPAM